MNGSTRWLIQFVFHSGCYQVRLVIANQRPKRKKSPRTAEEEGNVNESASDTRTLLHMDEVREIGSL